MPYRIDLPDGRDELTDLLIELGALDVERAEPCGIAALMPDQVAPEDVARALGVSAVSTSPATGRDADSTWVLRPRAVRAGRLRIVPVGAAAAEPGDVRLIDAPAFGTGLHPTTALCVEAIDEAVQLDAPSAVLDVGTGSGVLALAALRLGVAHATGVDTDEGAVSVAIENARINRLSDRFEVVLGGAAAVTGSWPLVVANIVAASLIEMAPVLVRRVGHHGRLVMSGIPATIEGEVERAYRRLGMRRVNTTSRAGWIALILQSSW